MSTARKPSATYLGTLCKRGYDHEGTGKSLRYGNGPRGGMCLVCRKTWFENYMPKWRAENAEHLRDYSSARAKRKTEEGHANGTILPRALWLKKHTKKRRKDGSYLGELCYRGHGYKDTGKTLRNSNGQCSECLVVLDREKYARSGWNPVGSGLPSKMPCKRCGAPKLAGEKMCSDCLAVAREVKRQKNALRAAERARLPEVVEKRAARYREDPAYRKAIREKCTRSRRRSQINSVPPELRPVRAAIYDVNSAISPLKGRKYV